MIIKQKLPLYASIGHWDVEISCFVVFICCSSLSSSSSKEIQILASDTALFTSTDLWATTLSISADLQQTGEQIS